MPGQRALQVRIVYPDGREITRAFQHATRAETFIVNYLWPVEERERALRDALDRGYTGPIRPATEGFPLALAIVLWKGREMFRITRASIPPMRDDTNRPTILSMIEQAIAQQPEDLPHGPRGRKQRKVYDTIREHFDSDDVALSLFAKIRPHLA